MIKSLLIANWKTGCIGLVLISAGLYSGITAKQSWTECGPIIIAGIGLVFSKDAQRNPIDTITNKINKPLNND